MPLDAADWGKQGMLGLVLMAMFAGVFLAAKWYAANVLKPKTDAELKGMSANQETSHKLAETVAALGFTSANTNLGVNSLVVFSQESRVEFQGLRRGWRALADAIEIVAENVVVNDAKTKTALLVSAARIREAMDDGSKEMRCLPDDRQRR